MRPKSPTWSGDPEGYTDYGFIWGPAEIMRAFEYRGRRMVLINTDTVSVEVVISPKGNNIEVYKRGVGRLVPDPGSTTP